VQFKQRISYDIASLRYTELYLYMTYWQRRSLWGPVYSVIILSMGRQTALRYNHNT